MVFLRKLGTKNKKHPSFKTERTIIPRDNQTRKKTPHHTPRSPQKKRQETVSPSTIAEPLSSVSLVAVSPVAEPLSSVSLVAVSPVAEHLSYAPVPEEVMPRALRSSEKTVRKNDGKYTPSFLKRRRVAGPQQGPEAHQD